jgi:hypothetical protein
MNWKNINTIAAREYVCGYCGNQVASDKGWQAEYNNHYWGSVHICPKCKCATFFANKRQYPGARFGANIEAISDTSVAALYEEARSCHTAGAYTGAVMCCRTILMHLAVANKAKEGESFASYVDHLVECGLVASKAKRWVDHIRVMGNAANHEIRVMTSDDSEQLIAFVEMLLKTIYEYPARVRPSGPKSE